MSFAQRVRPSDSWPGLILPSLCPFPAAHAGSSHDSLRLKGLVSERERLRLVPAKARDMASQRPKECATEGREKSNGRFL